MFQNTFPSKQHPPLSNHSRKPKEIKNKPTNRKTKTNQTKTKQPNRIQVTNKK